MRDLSMYNVPILNEQGLQKYPLTNTDYAGIFNYNTILEFQNSVSLNTNAFSVMTDLLIINAPSGDNSQLCRIM